MRSVRPKDRPVLAAGVAIAVAGILAATGLRELAWGGATFDVLMLTAAVTAGASIARRAGLALARRDVSIDVLVALAAIGAIAIGEFWEAAAVTFLFTFGHALEARTLTRTRSALKALLALVPDSVRLLRDGVEQEVAPHRVTAGDVVVVRPGERIPVDGRIRSGRAGIDQSTLTGESMPRDAGPGDEAFTGTTAHGYLEIEAERVGADTTLARIVRKVEEAQESKPRRQRFLERFAHVYTPAVVVGAALAWWISSDLHLALTLLVIACPGALVIATPVATVTGIGRAARDGVLFKGGEPLESLARVRTIAFDKTGTLTRGRPELREVVPLVDRSSDGARAALRLAARAESGSEHPIATALRCADQFADRDAMRDPAACDPAPRDPAPRAEAFEAIAGGGARATVDGQRVVVGSPALLRAEGVPTSPDAERDLERLRREGHTVAGLAVDGVLHACFALADPVRGGARDAIAALRTVGVRRVVMLTGDHRRAGETVAAALDLDEVHADLSPTDKADRIATLANDPRDLVAMVGDGVNDAPALARADVGVAMGAAGTHAALETAPVALMGDDLRGLADAVRIARRTVRVVHQNLAIAVGTVALLLAGVLAGEVHMAGGMLIHQASVLIVILNALRLARPIRPLRRAAQPTNVPTPSARATLRT